MRNRTIAMIIAGVSLSACQPRSDVPSEALAAIDTATIMRHIRVLSADSLMGRLPGTLGEEKTVA